jgi:hypothetical protein
MKWRDRDFAEREEDKAIAIYRAGNIERAVDAILRELRPLANTDPADLDPRIVAHLHRLLGHRLVESLLVPGWVHGAIINYAHAPNSTHRGSPPTWTIMATSFVNGAYPLGGIDRAEIGYGDSWIEAVGNMRSTFEEGPPIPEWWWETYQDTEDW